MTTKQFALLLYPSPEVALEPSYTTIVAPFESEAAAVDYGEKNEGDGLFQVFVMASPEAPATGTLDTESLAASIEELDEQSLHQELTNKIDDLVEEAVRTHFLHTADFNMEEKLQFLTEELPEALKQFLRENLDSMIEANEGFLAYASIKE